MPQRWRIETLSAAPLAVPLRDPFVIASGRVDVTPNVLIRVAVRDLAAHALAEGWGEAATLPPVTSETPTAVFAALGALTLPIDLTDDASLPAACAGLGPCARAGLEVAVLDAVGQLLRLPLGLLIAPEAVWPPAPITSDITLAIAAPMTMAGWATDFAARGFTAFKVKVGRAIDDDLAALRAIASTVPGCTLRIDANGGYTLAEALRLCDAIAADRLPVTCFEQPCATADLAAMAAVRRAAASCAPIAVLADESCKSLGDLDRILDLGAADGINLKLVKSGGIRACLQIGRAAQAAGLLLMVGAMVETRVGIVAAAHLTAALGGVAYPDLDTAWLLADHPCAAAADDLGPLVKPGPAGWAGPGLGR